MNQRTSLRVGLVVEALVDRFGEERLRPICRMRGIQVAAWLFLSPGVAA
jgi:hypothetical protein